MEDFAATLLLETSVIAILETVMGLPAAVMWLLAAVMELLTAVTAVMILGVNVGIELFVEKILAQ